VTPLLALVLAWLAGCAAAPVAAPLAPPPVPAPQVAAAEPEAPPAPPAPAAAAEPVPPSPPIEPMPRARLDPLDDSARTDLWQRVREGFALADLEHDLVRKWEQYYASRPDYVQRMAGRASRYLFHIVEEVQRRGLPTELALLPFVESAFDPEALSVARASGMWQFMPGTGRDFELRQNLFRDDRRDILASTRAALDYLERLHAQFGDWQLALAAYNWGQGNVLKAQARARRNGGATDYMSLPRMPAETRNYVPKLQAIKNIVARPEALGLAMPSLENHPYFVTVAVLRDIDTALVARLAGLEPEQFRQLNPQLEKPVILAAGTPRVLLPYDNANEFVRNLERHEGPLASWTAWVAPKTIKPAEAARLVGMREEDLRAVNRIPARMLVKGGSTLLVARSIAHVADVIEAVADNAKLALLREVAPRPSGARQPAPTASQRGQRVAAAPSRNTRTPPPARTAAAKPAPRRDVKPAARTRVAKAD